MHPAPSCDPGRGPMTATYVTVIWVVGSTQLLWGLLFSCKHTKGPRLAIALQQLKWSPLIFELCYLEGLNCDIFPPRLFIMVFWNCGLWGFS